MKKILIVLILCASFFSSSLQTSAQTMPKSPEVAANALYKAWQAKSRRAGLKVATKKAVNKLFTTRRMVMKFKGCTVREEGGYECIFRNEKLDLDMAMIVDGGGSVGGYNVVSLSFSSEG